MNDAAMVELARRDPQAGFAAIYDTYGDRLHDYCYSILRSRHDAVEALQETFVAAYEKLEQLRDPERLRPWLYAIARSFCFRRTRARQREVVSDAVELQMPGVEDRAGVESAELQALVWRAAAGLSEADRSVLELNVRQGLEGEALAAALGIAPSKAYVDLHRAKERMGKAVNALLLTKAGTGDCEELASIVEGHEFSPLLRKRVARHAKSCDACSETLRRVRPDMLLGLIPPFLAPQEARATVLQAIESAASSTVPSASERLTWSEDGFPAPSAGRRSASAARVAVGAGLAVAIVGLVGFFPLGDDQTTQVAGTAPTEVTVVEEPGTSTTGSPPGSTTSVGEPTSASSTASPPRASSSTSTTTTSLSTTSTTTTSSTVPADTTPPTASALRVTCDDPIVVEIDIADVVDPEPMADLEARWLSKPPVPLRHVGGGTYRLEVDQAGNISGGGFTVTVTGTAADASGNELVVNTTDFCSLLE